MLPLHGTKVIDLSRLLPGPLATLMLSDFGAEVIKVEEPGRGDYLRELPPLADDGMSVYFHALNRGKKSVVLDLKDHKNSGDARDKKKFLELLSTADVLVESFRPGVLKRLGLSPEWLCEQYPQLIICSITGYGQTGPLAQKAGHDLNFIARAGLLAHHQGSRPPTALISDIAGGAWPATTQILAALLQRQKTGRGCWIDVSLCAGAASTLFLTWARLASGHSDDSAVHSDLPCYRIYPTKDGHLVVASLEPKFWNPLMQALNLPQFENQGHLRGPGGQEIIAKLEQIFSQKTTQEWDNTLGPLDVCVEPVENTLNLHATKFGQPSMPLSASLIEPKREKAPRLGEHQAELVYENQKSVP